MTGNGNDNGPTDNPSNKAGFGEHPDADLNPAADAAAAGNGDAPSANDPFDFGEAPTGDGGSDDEGSAFDPARSGDEGEESIESLRAAVEAERARADDNWDRLLRLQAEMENQRKRALNDVTKARKFALENIVNDLLPVKDSLEMGIAASEQEGATIDSLREGSDLTLKMLASVFEKHNIVEINPLDEKFDPEFHQAMSMQEFEGKAPNTVATVMQKGYTLNDRLVRPALVMVAK